MSNVLKGIIFFFVVICYGENVFYTTPLYKQKSEEIQKALKLYQYLYDLEKLNQTLKMLYFNDAFKRASETAEMGIKNLKSKYTFEYIQALLKLLNGVNPYNDAKIGYYSDNKGGGYIQLIKDKFNNNYKMFVINYPYKSAINKNFKLLEENIRQNLKSLEYNLNNGKNIKPLLKRIFNNLILMLEEVEQETKELSKLKIISPFTKEIDERYLLPQNWAQTDGETTLAEIIDFILNGDRKYHFYGIKFYYERFYKDDLKPFIILE